MSRWQRLIKLKKWLKIKFFPVTLNCFNCLHSQKKLHIKSTQAIEVKI